MKIVLASFGGIVPRYSDHNLSNIGATIAHDVKLRNGRIEAWRELCKFADVSPTARSFHLHGCCLATWDEIVHAAEVAPDWGRFYITGRRPYLEYVEESCECAMTTHRAGVPTPMQPPVAAATEECSRIADARSYVYTYINKYFEESAPSPASNVVRVNDGSRVVVSGIALPPNDYDDVIGARIYRATTGVIRADGKEQKTQTEFLYVGSVDFPTTTFVDTIKGVGLGEALETHKVRPAPEGLRNIVAIEGVVRLAGTTGNQVHMTENFQLHNWPAKYDLTLDSQIVHMGALDQRLFVTTDTVPYVIDVSSCEDLKCSPVMDIQQPLPDISCGHASSAIITPHGFVYSSRVGLILIDPKAQWYVLTARWFSEDDWAQVRPETVRLGYWEGFLFIVTDTVTFLLNINGDPYGDMKGAELVTLSDCPVDLHQTSTGAMMLMQDGAVWVWNSGDKLREYLWVSRELPGNHSAGYNDGLPDRDMPLGSMWSPVSAKVRTQETTFTLHHPLRNDVFSRVVLDERPFRLPRVGRHMWYKVQFSGVRPVEYAELGTAHMTVNQGA